MGGAGDSHIGPAGRSPLASAGAAHAFLKETASRMHVGRLPFAPAYTLATATVTSRFAGEIDVAGVGLSADRALLAAAGEAVETLAQDLSDTDTLEDREAEGGWFDTLPPELRRPSAMAVPADGGLPFPVPAACVFRGVTGEAAPVPVSEGCGAGPTLCDARLAALLELVERDALARWWRSGRPARLLDRRRVERVGAPARDVALLDIGSGVAAPVAAVLSVTLDGSGFVLAAAARPTLAGACEAALRESLQFELGAILKARSGDGGGPGADLERVIGRVDPDRPAVTELTGRPEDILGTLVGRVEGQGRPLGFVDLDRQATGASISKAVSPRLLPSWLSASTSLLAREVEIWGSAPSGRDKLPILGVSPPQIATE